MSDKSKMYLAGPISGHSTWRTKQRFHDAYRKVLLIKGLKGTEWEPVCPLDIDAEKHEGDCPPGRIGMHGHNEACHIRADLRALLECDGILLLKDWESSWGASIELQVARASGLQIFIETFADEHENEIRRIA